MVHGAKVTVDAFVDGDNAEVKERIFDEFNKLSVLYGMPSERFINLNLKVEDNKVATEADNSSGDGSETLVSANAEVAAPVAAAPVAAAAVAASSAADEIDLLGGGPVSTPAPARPAAAAAASSSSSTVDILDDLMGGFSLSTPSASAAAVAAPSLQLVPKPAIEPPVFQSKWMALPVGATSQVCHFAFLITVNTFQIRTCLFFPSCSLCFVSLTLLIASN